MRTVLFFTILAIIFAGCGRSDSFTVTVDGGDNAAHTPYRLCYADASGAIVTLTEAADDRGHLRLTGYAPDWTIVTLSQEGSVPMLMLPMRNGHKATVTLSDGGTKAETIEADGPAKHFLEFLVENSGGNINGAIEKYVSEHPNDVVSAALMVTHYDSRGNERRADSLYSSIDAEARPLSLNRNYTTSYATELNRSGDPRLYPFKLFIAEAETIEQIHFNDHSYTLIAFVDRHRTPAIADTLATLRRLNGKERLQIVEVTEAPDSATWRGIIAGDTTAVGCLRGWVPAMAASTQLRRMAVPRLPFFILVDSTGMQSHRGSTISAIPNIILN